VVLFDQMKCAAMIIVNKLGEMWEKVSVVACFTVVFQNFYVGGNEEYLKSHTQVSQSSVRICTHHLNFKLL
jgi:hypothetical protein